MRTFIRLTLLTVPLIAAGCRASASGYETAAEQEQYHIITRPDGVGDNAAVFHRARPYQTGQVRDEDQR